MLTGSMLARESCDSGGLAFSIATFLYIASVFVFRLFLQ